MEKKSDKKNPLTHIYLYAKGHYKIVDHILDLARIIEEYSMVPAEYTSKRDVVDILLGIVYKHINSRSRFQEFILRLSPDQWWKTNCKIDDDIDFVIIKSCLSVLRLTEVKDLNLGDPDSSILPLKEKE